MARPQKQPLRPLTPDERSVLEHLARSSSERADAVARATALLAVAAGSPFTDAARSVARKSGDAVANLVARFNAEGLPALIPRHGGGPLIRYGPTEQARILLEFSRPPDRERDGTATWSLTTLQRALRTAHDGLPELPNLVPDRHRSAEAQGRQRHRDRSRRGTEKGVIELAYHSCEGWGIPLWGEDEAGPYQAIPQPGRSWQKEGKPARQPHEYVRGGVAKLLTLFHPATGAVRAQPVAQASNAVLHPWLKQELSALLARLPEPVERDAPGRRWSDWGWSEAEVAFFDPRPESERSAVRLVLIWDNLSGHKSTAMVGWCVERGIVPLYTPLGGSWLNLTESVQRILVRRALGGQHPESAQEVMEWLDAAVKGWNAEPTPFHWGGKRAERRQRARERRHRLGASGGYTRRPVPRRRHSVLPQHANAYAHDK